MDCLSSEREELCREVERLRQITQSALQEAAEDLPPDHNQLWDPPEHHLPLVRVQNFEDPAEHSQPLEHPGNPAELHLALGNVQNGMDPAEQSAPRVHPGTPAERHLTLSNVQVGTDLVEHSAPLIHPGNPAEHQLPLVVPVHPDPEELVLIEPMPADKHPTSFKLKRRKLSEFFVHAGCPGFFIYINILKCRGKFHEKGL